MYYACTEFRGVVEKTNMAVTFRMNKFRMEGTIYKREREGRREGGGTREREKEKKADRDRQRERERQTETAREYYHSRFYVSFSSLQ